MALTEAFESEIRPKLDAIDKIRDILRNGETGINLPSIAVIGSQSAGKSSVLERLSGIDLPRGDGMVTRCALVLRMCRRTVPSIYADICTIATVATEAGAFSKDERDLKPEEIAAKIRDYTDHLAPKGKISLQPINLTVYGSNLPDLTVIDLPGIIYETEDGDASIKDEIKKLYRQHIEEESCTILVAAPANLDPGTQEAIVWAREVDPDGIRTAGVITKIDKIENGRVADRLRGEGINSWKFGLGTVAMRNRSQDDLEKQTDAVAVTNAEHDFFAHHRELSALSKQDQAAHLGVNALVQLLLSIQEKAVAKAWPILTDTVRSSLLEKRGELKSLPEECTPGSHHAKFFELCNSLQSNLRSLLHANFENVPDSVTPAERRDYIIMARLVEYFAQFETQLRDTTSKVFSDPYREQVVKALEEVEGVSLPDTVTPSVINSLVAKMVSEFEGPAEAMLLEVKDYMRRFVRLVCFNAFKTFPHLEERCVDLLLGFVEAAHERCRSHLLEQLEMEKSPYTANHYYQLTLSKVRKWKLARDQGVADEYFVPTPWADDTLDKLESGSEDVPPGAKVPPGPKVSLGVDVPLVKVLPEPKVSLGVDVPLVKVLPGANVPITTSSNEIKDPPPKRTLDGTDNFSQSVLDTQISLYCYRKVLLKRFVDQIIQYVRLAFPRSLASNVANVLFNGIMSGSSGMSPTEELAYLMREDPRVAARRKDLLDSVSRLQKAQQEIEIARRTPLRPHYASNGAGARPT
jgi:hypothetical protein